MNWLILALHGLTRVLLSDPYVHNSLFFFVSFVLFVVLFFLREYLPARHREPLRRGGRVCPRRGPVSNKTSVSVCACPPCAQGEAGGSAANWEFLCGRHLQLIQEFMEGSGGEIDHHGLGPKGYFVSIFQLIGLV